MDTLMKDQLEFRRLLSEHGLIELAGGHEDAIAWLEQTATELVNSLSRRQRFIELLREARERLIREEGALYPDEDSPGCERKEKPHPFSARRFRRFIF